jgi:hypothetical protein
MKLLLAALFSFHAYNSTAGRCGPLFGFPEKLSLEFSGFCLSLKNFLLPGKLHVDINNVSVDYFKVFYLSNNRVFLFESGKGYKLISGFVKLLRPEAIFYYFLLSIITTVLQRF